MKYSRFDRAVAGIGVTAAVFAATAVASPAIAATTAAVSIGTLHSSAGRSDDGRSGRIAEDAEQIIGTDQSDGIVLPAGVTVVDPEQEATDLVLADGTAVVLPSDARLSSDGTERQVTFASGLIWIVGSSDEGITTQAAGYWPAQTYYMSRSQVEASFTALSRGSWFCGLISWLPGGIACSNSGGTQKAAITQAHYQKKRVKIVFQRSKTTTALDRTTYSVVK